MRAWRGGFSRPPPKIQQPTSNIQHPTTNLQRPTTSKSERLNDWDLPRARPSAIQSMGTGLRVKAASRRMPSRILEKNGSPVCRGCISSLFHSQFLVSLVVMSITTMTFAARDFSARRGGSDEHTLQGYVRSEQRRLVEKELPPGGLRRIWPVAALLVGHRSTSGYAPSSRLAPGQFRRNAKGGMSFGRRLRCSLLTDPLRDMLVARAEPPPKIHCRECIVISETPHLRLFAF